MLTSCALDHLTWENTEPPGTSVLNGVTVHRFPTASRRLLDYFELDGKLRVSPTTASLAESRSWVALNGPMCPDLVDAVAATDADVVACYPYLFATTVDAIAVARVPTVLHPAAHDEPALYLSAFRQQLPGHRRPRVPHPGRAGPDGARVRDRGPTPDRPRARGRTIRPGAGRPGGDILGIGDRPYLCYLGRVDEHKGCAHAGRLLRRVQGTPPGRPGAGLRRTGVGQGPRPSRHRGDRHGVRSRQVGHPGRRRGDGHPVGLRVVLAGGARGMDARGPGAGQRVVRRHHGALPAIGWRPVVRLLPHASR